ncbi:MAG: shikimate kinase [Coriobacteriia bacterium]|nr:shikimate kinase [Coriobacteriia bacterium]
MTDNANSAATGGDHIFFIGFMGAGKTTLARNLGTMFQRKYVDTDKIISRNTNMTVREIFERYGEDEFRKLETEALASLRNERSFLVSCGDGIVEVEENFDLLKELGKVVYLDIDYDGALAKIRSRRHRPLLGEYEETLRLFEHRLPLYKKAADYSIDIRDMSFKDVANYAGELLWNEGLL